MFLMQRFSQDCNLRSHQYCSSGQKWFLLSSLPKLYHPLHTKHFRDRHYIFLYTGGMIHQVKTICALAFQSGYRSLLQAPSKSRLFIVSPILHKHDLQQGVSASRWIIALVSYYFRERWLDDQPSTWEYLPFPKEGARVGRSRAGLCH